MLGFEAETGVLLITDAGLAGSPAVEEIPRVELYAGLCGVDFQDAAGLRVGSAGGEFELPVGLTHRITVIVTDGVAADLLQSLADAGGLCKIHGCSFDAMQ